MASGSFSSWVTSEIAAVSVLNDADSMVVIQGGEAKKVTIAQMASKFGGGGSPANAFGRIAVAGQSDVVADQASDTVTFVAGTNMNVTTSAAGDTVTFNASGGGGGGDVASVNGQTGVVTLDQDDIGDGTNFKQYSNADKAKLASVATNAVNAAGAAAAAPVQSVLGLTGAILLSPLKTALALVKGDVGLGNADNTSDASKPISTLTQAALDTKINTSTLGAANGTAQLGADSKLRSDQIPASLLGAANYQGAWNASTNSPTLSSGSGTKGFYYVVDTAGTTNLDGITDWKVGDWAIYSGTAYQKIDNTDAVISVNGQIGAVTLVTDNIAEGSTNKYWTALRTYTTAITGFSAAAGTVAATDTIVQAFNKIVGNIAALTTTAITEGTNLYYTAARVITAPITGFSASAGVVAATDTILQAINKIVGNMGLLATKNVTTTVGTSRSLTSADNGNTLELTAATLSITVPTGLGPNFGCVIIPNGTTSLVSSGGTLLNGATTTLTRSSSVNAAFAILPRSATDSYVVNGI